MSKKILLPTDFSRNAWSAMSYAIELFKNEDCEFFVFNVFDTSGYALEKIALARPNDKPFDLAHEHSEKELGKLSQRLSFRDESTRHEFTFLSMHGEFIPSVKDIVEKKDVELVVMGTKGTTDATSVVFGSNAISAMEKIRNCPVLVIPPDVIYTDPKEIVFPTSFKTHYKRRELQYLVEIARLTNAPIRILHVAEEGETLDETQENYKAMLEEYFDGLEYSFHTMYDVKVQTALDCFVQSRESGMITFINKKHTFFENLFSRPLVKDLGYHTRVPVLALHDLRN